MLRGLLHEIVRRRLWPIPVVALLVAVAAPLLFLKSSPGGAPRAQSSQPASAADGLPARAQRLLRTNAAPGHRAKKPPKADDPFQGPGSAGTAPSDAGSSSTSGGPRSPASPGDATPEQKPIPVVITDTDAKATKGTTEDKSSKATDAESSGSDASHVAVDMRFAKAGGRVRRAIPRRKPFTARGRVVASFVKYSPASDKAVFAISPNTLVAGVRCRRKEGLCRYVDLPAGKHVRLTIAGPGGTFITRRLGVVRIHPVSGEERRPSVVGACLLRKLLKLRPGDSPVLTGACG
ncbi:MAG: hypothetical protein M3401_03600 [Actinomycetota bacterium]|nr:hypothetical protein [Actinomycetota bacterium]